MIERGKIVLCNLKVKTDKGKALTISKVVFSNNYDSDRNVLYWSDWNDQRTIRKSGVSCDLTILDIEVIAELGYKNKSKGFTEAKRSEEKRNDITGAYD